MSKTPYATHQKHLTEKQARNDCEWCKKEQRHPVTRAGAVVRSPFGPPMFRGWEFDWSIGIMWTADELLSFMRACQAIRAAPEIGEAARNAP